MGYQNRVTAQFTAQCSINHYEEILLFILSAVRVAVKNGNECSPLTDIAWQVASELEPERSIDVFDVTDSEIIFQSEHGLKRVCLPCLDSNGPMKAQIKKELLR